MTGSDHQNGGIHIAGDVAGDVTVGDGNISVGEVAAGASLTVHQGDVYQVASAERCQLLYDIEERAAATTLADGLRADGIDVRQDVWNLTPGDPLPAGLQEALEQSATAVVLVGMSGIGPWQNENLRAAVDARLAGGLRVVPVLLPGARRPRRSHVPEFLVATTWVEFHEHLEHGDAQHRLLAHVRGVQPAAERADRPLGPCPYLGLRAFGAGDADNFFGREALTEWLIDELRDHGDKREDHRFQAIVGASGSGKSSLARAGLLPALAKGALPGSADWPQLILRPGTDPLESLAIALCADSVLGEGREVLAAMELLQKDARSLHLTVRQALHGQPEDRRVIILIDQFEEVFSLGAPDQDERERAFLDNLLHASSVTGGQTVVLLTMRADFYGKCAQHAELARALSDHQTLITAMNESELRRAIERPAQRAGAVLEAGLTDLLIEQVAGQSGALPLLQHALEQLWHERDGRRLTLAAYRDMEGIEGSLERHAEAIYHDLSDDGQNACRRLFMRLITPGEGTGDTRRRVALPELGESQLIDDIVQRLTDERLLTTEGEVDERAGEVEISHEALLRGWSRLQGWLEDSRDMLRVHNRLSAAAREWYGRQAGGDLRAADYLYTGARLLEVEEWHKEHGESLNARERAFVEASVARRDRSAKESDAQIEWELRMSRQLAEAQERQARQQQRVADEQRARIRMTLMVGAVALALVFVAGWYFWQARDSKARSRAATEELSRVSRVLTETRTSLDDVRERNRQNTTRMADLLATRANELLAHPEQALHAALLFARAARWTEDASGQIERSFRATLAGARLPRPRVFAHEAPVLGAVLSRDENKLLSWSRDGVARLWDVASGQPIGEPMKASDTVWGARFTPDQRYVLTAEQGEPRLWNAHDSSFVEGQPSELIPLAAAQSIITRRVFSPDGRLSFDPSNDALLLQETDSGEIAINLRPHEAWINGGAFSPDGRRIVTWSQDGTARVLTLGKKTRFSRLMRHPGFQDIQRARFSRDGNLVVTWDASKDARVWDAASGRPRSPFMRHDNSILGAAFSPDGRRILSETRKNAQQWDARTGKPIGAPIRHGSRLYGARYSPDGRHILTWSGGKEIRIWSATSGRPVGEPLRHLEKVRGAHFISDSRRVLSWSDDHTARIWHLEAPTPPTIALPGPDYAEALDFSRDGRLVLSCCLEGAAHLWDARTGTPVGAPLTHAQGDVLRAEERIRQALLSPDGTRVVTRALNEIRVWSNRGQLLSRFAVKGRMRDISFSPDRRQLLLPGEQTIRILDVESGRSTIPAMHHGLSLSDAAFDPGGQRVFSWSEHGSYMIWDAASGVMQGDAHSYPPNHRLNQLSGDRRWVLLDIRGDYSERLARVSTLDGQRSGGPLGQPRVGIKGVTISRDGQRVLTWDISGHAQLWDTSLSAPVGDVMEHEDEVMGGLFDRTGDRAITWTKKSIVSFWNATTGAPLGSIAFYGRLRRAAFSHDGRRLALWIGGELRIIALPDPADGMADWTPRLVELHFQIISGHRLDSLGQREAIPNREWHELYRTYQELVSHEPAPGRAADGPQQDR